MRKKAGARHRRASAAVLDGATLSTVLFHNPTNGQSSAHDDSKEGFSDFSENSKMARTCKKVVSGDLGASTSVVTCWTHLISWAQLTLLAMYSARQLLRFTVGCFLLFHDMEPPNPLTDFLLST